MTANLADIPQNIFDAGPAIYLQFGQFGIFATPPLNYAVAIGLLVALVLSSAWIVRIHRGAPPKQTVETKIRWACIYLASLWFLVFGPLPYVLLDYEPAGRIYSSAVYGVFPLLLMAYETVSKKLLRILTLGIILLFAGFGLLMLRTESMMFNYWEAPGNIFYRGLKDAVPYVRPNTVFIIIDGPLSYAGCGPSLQMLYNQRDLKCAIFSSIHPKYMSIRRATEIVAGGQHLSGENWILIAVNDNVPRVLEELKPGDFNLFLTWERSEPLHTDTRKIVTEDLPPPSDFYLHLLQRATVLFPE
jgi:hypothetical protein